MARSTYVYVVMTTADFPQPESAFTVKHELITWLRRQEYVTGQEGLDSLSVWRIPDGGGERRPIVRMDMQSLLEAE